MKKVDVPQVLISTAAIFGIGLIWYDFNVKVFNTVRDLLNATLYNPDAEEERNNFDLNFCMFPFLYLQNNVRQQAC